MATDGTNLATLQWGSDDLLRTILERAGWTITIRAERGDEWAKASTIQSLFAACGGGLE